MVSVFSLKFLACDFTHEICVNAPGSYSCRDLDECSTDSHVCDTSISSCKNVIGSYKCNCFDGFQGWF